MTLARQRSAYRESLREEILDAARQLFIQHGYESTSIRAIAEKVGASPGILYHYFEDKQDIMALLVRETFAKLSRRVEAIRTDRDNPLARLRRGLRAYVDFGLEHPNHYALLFMKPSSWEGSDRILAVFQSDGASTFNCLRLMCAECIGAGLFRAELGDAEEIAQTLWAAIHGLVSVQIGCRDFPFLEPSRLTDRLIEILLQGILRS
jgi:AcrR family transcriptional regulator